MQRRKLITPAILLTVLSTVCGASSSSVSGDIHPTKASAVLNPALESAEYPLDKYSLTTQELNLIERAGTIKIQECMSQNGQPIDLMTGFKDRTSAAERPYGIWVMADARVFGYDRALVNLGIPHLETKTAEFNRQWDSCLTQAFPTTSYGTDRDSLSNQLTVKASAAANRDPQTKNLISEWKECLQGKGAHFDNGDSWSPVEAFADMETATRIAVSDVQCKENMNFVQQMADIESSYQATLVQENETALLAQRQTIDRTLKHAADIVATFTTSR